MSSNTKTQSASTKKLYFDIHNRLLRRSDREDADADADAESGSAGPMRITRCLVRHKGDWSKKTWILYRAAVLTVFEWRLTAEKDEYILMEIKEALALLKSESQSGARRMGTRTSALKAKKIDLEDEQALLSYLQIRDRTNPRSMQLIAYIRAAIATGLRPSEWEHAEMEVDACGEGMLVVRNAKATNGRGNGQYRTLQLRDLLPIQRVAVEGMVAIAKHFTHQPGGYPAWQRRMRHLLRRSAQAALGKKRRKYPSMYTFRHQFAANAKATYSREEVAALLGHGSSATAGRHYAKARQGNGKIGVHPLPSEVLTVHRPANVMHPNQRVDLPPADSP